MPRSLTYSIKDFGGQPFVDWIGECELTASDNGQPPVQGRRGAGDGAQEFLLRVLADGPKLTTAVKELAGHEGITPRTLDRARAILKVKSFKEGFAGKRMLKLPEERQPAREGRQPTFG